MEQGTRKIDSAESHLSRRVARGLVFSSGVVFLFLGIAMQRACWAYHSWVMQQGLELPQIAVWFVQVFCRPATWCVIPVVWCAWWPMIVGYGFCVDTSDGDREFEVRVAFWFALCWLLAILICTMIAGLAVLSTFLTFQTIGIEL